MPVLHSVLRRKPLVLGASAVSAATVLVRTTTASGQSAPDAESAGAAPEGEAQDENNSEQVDDVLFAIHGGAGGLSRDEMGPGEEREFRKALTRALRAGHREIRQNGSSTDAVESAITVLEDSPIFNAGKGAVFNTDAENALDASIMDGQTLDSGAVTGTRHITNPISLSREIMDNSDHVMLDGEGAELFAQHRGIDLVTQDYFFTEDRCEALWDDKGGESNSGIGENNTVGDVGLDNT